jgi:ATP-dependent RNA helicase RhlE
LLDHVEEGTIDLSGVEVLVLDEADTMCDMGFLPDVRRILSHLPARRQTLMFSATMPEDIRKLAFNILSNPTTVQVDPIAPARTVSHALYPVTDDLKKDLLLALLEQTPTGRALVFTRTKHRTRRLALDLAKHKYRVSSLQGNLSQNRRQQAMEGFRDGTIDILVATDIAAHGIDVPEVSHVINFDMPDTVDAYTHRIGRTGRALQTGQAFTLAVPSDEPMVRGVEKVLNARIERRRLPGFGYGDFNPETQFPERRPDQPQRDGRRAGSNSGNHSPITSQKTRRTRPAVKSSLGKSSIDGATRPNLSRRPSSRRG